MRKFKVGDVITPKSYYQGFENITVLKSDDKTYTCKIVCGTVTIPTKTIEENYLLVTDSN